MAEGRQREKWVHTSCLMAIIYNGRMGLEKADLRSADYFNPFAPKSSHDDAIEVPFDTLQLLARQNPTRADPR